MNYRSLAALALAAALAPALAAPRKPHPPDPVHLVAAIDNAHKLPLLGPGSQGAPVIRAQALLDRHWFAPGPIDGRFSADMQRAVRAFQFARGLRPSGQVDAPTWQALQADGAKPLARYVVAAGDAPKGASAKRLLQALAERFHSAPALLQKLNRGRALGTGSELVVPAVLDTQPRARAASVQVLKGDRQLLLLDAGGRPVAAFPVALGRPLAEGEQKVQRGAKGSRLELTKGCPLEGGAGCLRLASWDARRVASQVEPGFVVDVLP
jgi:peptidoglycan hydrolase-like protein with peptidoglycan-binding domain